VSEAEPDQLPPPPPPQVIPRPASWRPGPPPPWAGVAEADRQHLDLAQVRSRLTDEVDPDRLPAGPRESAVLALLFERSNETRVLLTRRAETLRHHRTEVSFPGGRIEPGETILAAGRREAWEEVGIPQALPEVIGTLTPLMTFTSQALIHPYAAVLPELPPLRVNPAEVARAFDVSLAELLADGVYHCELWNFGTGDRPLHFYELPGDIVWGATGRLLTELLARVTRTEWALDPDLRPLP
jgi:8-oxo-dGTP pyrophosphatase MutT (NUDIX family)